MFKTALLVVCFSLFLCTPVKGEEIVVTELNQKNSPTLDDKNPSLPVNNEIDIKLELPAYPGTKQSFCLSEVTWDDHRTIRLKQYSGLQGIAISRIQSYYNRYANNTLELYWNSGAVSLFQYEQMQQRYWNRVDDWRRGWRWEDRTFFDYLPPERGGQIVQVDNVGKELQVFQFEELSLTNTGKIRIGDWRLMFYNAFSSAPNQASQSSVIDPASATTYFRSVTPPPFGFRTYTPQGNIFTTKYASLSCNPSVTLRADLDYRKILSNAEMEFRFRFFANRKTWGTLTISGRVSPYDQKFVGTFNFELLCF